MKTLNEFMTEQLKDPEFREEYDKIQPELDVIREFLKTSHKRN